VLRAGGVTRAAQQLHRVQSNVTTRVKKLEEELGVALFTRDGRRLRLSPAGNVLLEYSDRFAALVAEPVVDARLATVPVYTEELVMVTSNDHPPIRTPRDLTTRTLLAFHPGCPHRMRLEDWFERGGMLPDRIVEMASYHAILGCAVVGMGVAVMPGHEPARLLIHSYR
jgi:DNA-binding transcriptional LysR family regulator